MVWLRVILVINVLWINGCAFNKTVQKQRLSNMTMMDIYADSAGQAQKDVAQFVERNLKEQKTFGYVKPYIPVINEPVVRKVWIPDHKSEENTDAMIAGHWVYLMIQPPTWFIEGQVMDTRLPVIVPSSPKDASPAIKKEEDKEHGDYNESVTENF